MSFPSPPAPRLPSPPVGDPLDRSVLDQLKELGGPDDPAFLPGVLRAFLEHLERARATWRAGSREKDPTALRAAAHGLKGAAGNVGARELSRRAATLDAVLAQAGRAAPTLGGNPAVVGAVAALEEEAERVRVRVQAELAELRS